MDGSDFFIKNKQTHRVIITDEMVSDAKSTICKRYATIHASNTHITPPDLNVQNVAIKTTLRRIHTELNQKMINDLSQQDHDDFLFQTHMLLTGKGKPRTKKNMMRILRTIAKDPLLEREDKTRQRQEQLHDHLPIKEAVRQQLLAGMIKDKGTSSFSNDCADKVANFVNVYMPQLATDLTTLTKPIGEKLAHSGNKLTNLQTSLVTVSEYLDFGEGQFEDHVAFADSEEKRFLRTKINEKLNQDKKRSTLFRKDPKSSLPSFLRPENKGKIAKIHEAPQPANAPTRPSAFHAFRRVAAVIGIGIATLFGYASPTDDNNSIQNNITQAGLLDIPNVTASPIAEPIAHTEAAAFDAPAITTDNHLHISLPDPIVNVSIPPQLPTLSPDVSMAFSDVIIPPTQKTLSLNNTDDFIRSIYNAHGVPISDTMQSYFDKTSDGLNDNNMRVAAVGAYDAARLMSQELGLDVAGLESRKVYEMIEDLNVAHPVSRWAKIGAAMKVPSPNLS